MDILKHNQPFQFECGKKISSLEIAFTTYGKRNVDASNVVWICHALTANADPMEWWPGLVGPGKLYDPERHYIVCANMLGSCYGSSSPVSIDPETNQPYGKDFPDVTVRDMVKGLQILKAHLQIQRILIATGGSMGGQQTLEWAIMEPDLFEHICVIGTNARHSPWGIAFNEAQRMALRADQTLFFDGPDRGKAGLEAARAIAMLSYRNYEAYHRTQMDKAEKLDDFKASSYQRYQGLKLSRRFDALCYLLLTRAMDSHDVGRGRGGIEIALATIKANALIFGIETDYLFPLREQKTIHKHIPRATLEIIHSPFGHDGFLIEYKQMTEIVNKHLG